MKHFCIFIIIAVFLLAGCASKVVQTAQPATSGVTEKPLLGQGDDTKGRGGITEEELARAERERLLREQENSTAALLKDISFDYDSYSIKPSELPKIEAVGTWLKQNRTVIIIVEGHCDERGTIEYNMALGQKRAEAVKNYLSKNGADTGRIKAISFGKEVPVDPGNTEEAWSKNRRVHFKIDQKG
jgi:peptidoglycan-associated lipoprotein